MPTVPPRPLRPRLALVLGALTAALAPHELAAQSAWRQIQLPDARAQSAAVQDPGRGMILFGGWNDFELGDTWLLDGQQPPGQEWTRVTTPVTPPTRYGAKMVHDAARDVFLLYGGYGSSLYRGELWVWDRQAWSQLFPPTGPGALYQPGFVWDVRRGRAVLYGGKQSNGALSGSTWEWDGNQWTQLLPSSAPGARYYHGMVYDPGRGETVVFGGYAGGVLNDTWIWDGSTWTQPAPPVRPPAREEATLAYDAGRGVVVMFGGWTGSADLGDTWEWNGTTATWTQRSPAVAPPPRHNAVMVYDDRSQRVVLFGGDNATSSPDYDLSDVWEWDGAAGTWTERLPTMPTGRWYHRMAYDAQRDEVVLFGGAVDPGSTHWIGDTWLWNGSSWRAAATSTAPGPRGSHGLTYDPMRQQVVLFGGYNGAQQGDTWTWDGTAWTQQHPAASPSARNGFGMTWDDKLGEVVLFGGAGPSPLNDLWTWNGTTWTNRTSGGAPPPPRWHTAIAYDPVLDRIVLFGGWSGSTVLGDTWSWTLGAGWVKLSPLQSPPARRYHAMEYDPSRGAVVLFDGSNSSGTYYSDTWELRGSTWKKCTQLAEPPSRDNHAMVYDSKRKRMLAFGGYLRGGDLWECVNPNPASFEALPYSGCPLSGMVPQLTSPGGGLPWRGKPFTVTLSPLPMTGLVNGFLIVAGPVPVNLPLGALGYPACTIRADLLNGLVLPMAPAGPGAVSIALPIPPLVQVVGAELILQGIGLSPFGPPPQLGLSPAMEATIGARHP